MILILISLFLISSCSKIQTPEAGRLPVDYHCDDSCKPPSCFCASSHPPGGLELSETPQFILLTVDDAVDQKSYHLFKQITAHKNPNGCPLTATFFVTTNYTDFWLVERLHAEGHEIAVHTMTHRTQKDTDYKKWRAEIMGARGVLSQLARIPKSEIQGFRAPYLKHNPESFRVLSEENFIYDSSITEITGPLSFSKDPSHWIWPYTLDYGTAQRCFVGICPTEKLPGLFEVPPWALESEASEPVTMDPEGSREEILELFKQNFLNHYQGNRAPLMILVHAPWLSEKENFEAVNDFILWAGQFKDVWFVSISKLLAFMRQPGPSQTLGALPKFSCPAPLPIVEGMCDGGKKYINSCHYPEGNFRTCADCPDRWPSI